MQNGGRFQFSFPRNRSFKVKIEALLDPNLLLKLVSTIPFN